MVDQLSLQAGRVTVFQDVDDTTAFTVEVTDAGTPVDLSGSTWADPDGLMTVDATDAVNGRLGLSCGVQTGNQDWRLQADGDTTWLQGTLVVGSTRHVGAGTGTISVAVEDQAVTVSAVVPTHDHNGAYVAADRINLNGTTLAQIQTTIDNAAAAGRGVWVDSIYEIDGALTIPDGSYIFGHDPSQCGFKLADGTNPTTTDGIVRNADLVSGNTNITVSGISIDGNAANNTTMEESVVKFTGCTDLRLVDVIATGSNSPNASGGAGILISGGQWIWLTRCVGHGNDNYGIATAAFGATAPTNVTMDGCVAYDNAGEGIHTSTGTNVTMTGCHANSNGTNGFNFTNASEVVAQGCHAKSNGFDGFTSVKGEQTLIGCSSESNRRGYSWQITGSTSGSDIILSECVARANTQEGIYFATYPGHTSGVERVYVSDCIVRANGSGYDAVAFEDAFGDMAIYRVEGGAYEAVGAGRSVNFSTADFTDIYVKAHTPQGVYRAGSPLAGPVLVPASQGVRTLGSAVLEHTNHRHAWKVNQGERVSFTFDPNEAGMPDDWTTYDVYLRWFNDSAAAGDVAFNPYTMADVGDGDTLDTPSLAGSVVVTAPAQNVVEYTQVLTGLTWPTGLETVSVMRSTGASDTLGAGNEIGYLGLELRKAS